jgi:hypothetical protein
MTYSFILFAWLRIVNKTIILQNQFVGSGKLHKALMAHTQPMHAANRCERMTMSWIYPPRRLAPECMSALQRSFEAHAASGRAMSFDQALGYALGS